ncbi:MAG: fibrinogen-like YCDxxxxGGGW domain-containing protein [Acidimicrobiales bacterium]
MRTHLPRPKRALGAIAALAVVATAAVTVLGGSSAQAAIAAPGDGTSSATAGASCWGIKQAYGASASGVYWLSNARMERPQQFYCDMTTDGGGWVLVGRGRQGWSFNPFGQGSPNTLRSTPDGTGAFAPAALDSSTIDGLLNGQAVRALPDGIRLERATNSSGTNRQSYRIYPRVDAWTWSFHAGQLLDKVVIDGSTYQGSNTYDTADSVYGQTTNQLNNVQGTRRMFTYKWSSHNNQAGFSFGSGVSGGSSSSSNYLWTNGNEGYPIPFTRVWIRPQIANAAAGFSPIPAAGYPAAPLPAQLGNRSEQAPWGVVGLDHTDEPTIEPWNTNVLSVRAHGDRTFIGGRFTGVQNGPSASPIAQPYLAAFSYDGTWIDTFRPQLDGRVWDMLVTPDGKLIIAGDFTNVNGAPNTSGIAALDPQTGQVVAGFKAAATSTSGRPLVRALAQRDGIVYAAGNFNRFTGGSWNQITVTRAVSFSATDGTPSTWRPRASGQVVRIRVSQDGTRVLMAGYFSNVNGDTNMARFAITDRTTGNPVSGIGAWTPSVGSNKTYQQAVIDFPNGNVAVGGSEHNLQLWNRDRTQMLDASVTKQGGDTQLIETFGDKTYVGCHCGNWVYEGTNDWTSPTGFRAIKPINLIGAWDTATWQQDTTWYPSSLKGAKGEGTWAADMDSRGCLWVGGDLVRGAYSGNAANDWLGGFARFCQQDATAPTTPTSLHATTSGADVVLSWGAATDASGTVSYDVYRDDRVIGTVWGRSYTDPEVTGTHRYTVRAVDARGNRSASPAPVNVNGPSPVLATPIAFNTAWRYLADGSDQGTAWRAPAFGDGGWPTGNGRLGWGMSTVATTVSTTKPLTTYYRRSFSVADAASVRMLDLKLYNLQGAVVYVNGVEAGRLNMPAGAVTSTTPAAGYLTAAQEQALKSISVPGSLLVNGTNVIAVESHNVTAGASRSQFDLQATLYGTGGDTSAPSAPSATATAGAGLVDLSWTASTDDVGLAGYLIERDGAPLAVVGPTATAYRDAPVDTAAPHTYVVTAFDGNGNRTAAAPASVTPVADPNLLAYGATWRWYFAEGGPTGPWAAPGYDDAAWATGPAELGYGDSDEKTVISTSPTPRPLTAYFRTTIDVADPAAFTSVVAKLVRDDGAVLYVNGVEVGRDNLPDGPIEFATGASRIISNRAEERAPVTFTIPSTAFVAGTNTIAVEVHNSDRWSGDLSMDLQLTGQP